MLNGWTGFPDDPLEIRLFIPVRYGTETQTCSLTFTLAGVKAGSPGETASIYSLYPSTSFFSKRESGTIEPGSITCQVLKKNGKTIEEVSNLDGEGIKIIYTTDDNNNSYRKLESSGLTGTDVQGIDKYVKFVLVSSAYTSTSTPPLNQSIDIESVPVVKDGSIGKSILAKSEYWCVNAYETPSDPSFPAKETLGQSPSGWTMTGQYFAADDEQCRHRLNATGTIPVPNETYPNLWKWEKYWYSDGDHYSTDVSLVTSLSDEVTAIETWYRITLDNSASEQDIMDRYDSVTEYRKTPSEAGFTNLSSLAPRELGMVGDECEVRWQFNRVVYAQKPYQCLGIGIVDRYYKPLMDIDILKGMFGEANVQGKRGAYLREFLGVMGSLETGERPSDDAFFNYDVKAFMNATGYWYKDPTPPEDQYKGRVMFAAGVTNLGSKTGQNNHSNWDDISGNTNPDGEIDMDNFRATTVIWEGGELDCNKAVISGEINAYSGTFGGRPDTTGCIRIGEDGLHGFSADNTTEIFSFTDGGVEIGGANDALHIDSGGITGKTSGGSVLFQLDSNGLVANRGSFNGDVSATTLYVNNSRTSGYETKTSNLIVSPTDLFNVSSEVKNSRYKSYKSFSLSTNGLLIDNVAQNADVRTQTLLQEGQIAMTQYDIKGTYANSEDDEKLSETSMKPDEIRFTTYVKEDGEIYKLHETKLTPRSLRFDFNMQSNEGIRKYVDIGLDSNSKPQVRVSDSMDSAELSLGAIDIYDFDNGEFYAHGGKVLCDKLTAETSINTVTLTASSRVYASAFYESSDERQKNVGEPLTNVLDKLEEIPTVYYKWRDHRDDDNHVGTLAQSLLSIFPEVVGGSEETGYTVDYAKLSIIALAAIKELKGEVDELKDTIRKLRT